MSQSNEEDGPEVPIPMSMIDDELPTEPRRGLRKFGGREIPWRTLLVGVLIVAAILAFVQMRKSANEGPTPGKSKAPAGDVSAGSPSTPTTAVAALVGTLNLSDTPLHERLSEWIHSGRIRIVQPGHAGLPTTPRSADDLAKALEDESIAATSLEISRLALVIAQIEAPTSLAIDTEARYAKVSLEHRRLVLLSETEALNPFTGEKRPRASTDTPHSGAALRATERGLEAVALLRQGQTAQAAESARKALDLNATDSALQVLQGQIQVESGQTSFGTATLEGIVKRIPDAWTHYQLGLAEMAAERLFKAFKSFTQATALDPTLADAWVARANLQIQRLEWMPADRHERAIEDARNWLKTAEELDPRGLEVGLLRAQFHMLEGSMAAASQALKDLATSQPDAVEPRLILGQLALQEARFPDAAAQLELARATHPDHPEVLHLLALALLSDAQWTQGITVLEHLLSVRPDDPEVRVHLAQALQESGQNDRAQTVLLEQVQRFPDNRHAPLLLAQVTLNTGNSAAALGYTRESIRRAESVDARVLEMIILATLGRRPEAFTIADALERSVPGSWSLLAEALASHGEMELLRVFLEHVLEVDPRQEDLRVLLAMAHLLMNNPAAANVVKTQALASLTGEHQNRLAAKFQEGFTQAEAILAAAQGEPAP